MRDFKEYSPEVQNAFNQFLQHYQPATEVGQAKVYASTEEICERMRLMGSCNEITSTDIDVLLTMGGFIQVNMGNNAAFKRWVMQ